MREALGTVRKRNGLRNCPGAFRAPRGFGWPRFGPESPNVWERWVLANESGTPPPCIGYFLAGDGKVKSEVRRPLRMVRKVIVPRTFHRVPATTGKTSSQILWVDHCVARTFGHQKLTAVPPPPPRTPRAHPVERHKNRGDWEIPPVPGIQHTRVLFRSLGFFKPTPSKQVVGQCPR